MDNNLKVAEIFTSLQGEGRFTGTPMLFIRLSGCTRACEWCDSKFHINGTEMSIEEVIEKINNSKVDYVCWTGGEPTMQFKAIEKVIEKTQDKEHHIETNGDLITDNNIFEFSVSMLFDYLAISPKEEDVAKKVKMVMEKHTGVKYDIKVVTDLEKEGMDMLEYATILMPLSSLEGDAEKDKQVAQKVWQYCVDNNKKFSSRLQVWIYGISKRAV